MSFVLPCRNEGDYLRETLESLAATVVEGPYEILVIDNGSEDGCSQFLTMGNGNAPLKSAGENHWIGSYHGAPVELYRTDPLGVVGARTFGLERSRSEVVFFCDAHVTFRPAWLGPCLEVLSRSDVGLVAPASAIWGQPEPAGWGMRWTDARFNAEWLGQQGATPYPIPMAAGFCTGMRKSTFQAIGGYDPGMKGYGMEDLEICLRLWLLGQGVYVVPEAVCAHLFRSAHPYPVSWHTYLVNMIRTAVAHFSGPRLERCLAEWKGMYEFESALAQEMSGDIWERRRELFAQRVADDNWFFEAFGLSF